MHAATVLKQLLSSGETLVMPDAYDPLSARMIEKLGFPAVQCSGFSMALAVCCPSEAEFGRERNVAATAAICQAVTVPVMADAEDGFGDAAVVAETARLYLQAGVAGLNLEDQVLGVPGPKQLVPREAAAAKIRAARQAAADAGVPDLVINARTDALTAGPSREEGLAEAATRANLYLAAGADLAFVVAVATVEEARRLVGEVQGPVSIAAGMPYNLGLSVAELRECGVARVSLPSLMVFAAIRAMMDSLASVRQTDCFDDILTCSMEDAARLLQV